MPSILAALRRAVHPPIRQQLLDCFTAHDYALAGKYWRVEADNLWFAPRASVGDR